jgi:SAM-dependent methyltransferase
MSAVGSIALAPIEGSAAYWDKASDGWQAGGCDRLWRCHSDAVNIAFLACRLPEGRTDRILKTDMFDEASTAGLMPLLESRARTVVGIDLSTAVLRAAGTRYPKMRQTAADVRELPFNDDSFDCIVSNSTLDHFPRRDELLRSVDELVRILRPGGRLILMLDNPSNPVVGLRNALPFNWLHRIGILPYYVGATLGGRALRRAVEARGCVVRETAYVLHCPRVLAVPITRRASRWGQAIQQRLLRMLMSFECLANLPTARFTGHFVVVCAEKR